MTASFEIEAQLRTETGKSIARRLRREEDRVPGVIYGAHKDPQAITVDHNKISLALQNESFYSQIIYVKMNGEKQPSVLRAVQRHPYKPKILHIDFQRISETEELKMSIPLHFKGEEDAPGVKTDGGVISHLQTTVEVSCLPKHLPEYIEVDVSNLALNDAIHLSQLKLPEGITLVELAHGNDLAVVSVHIPRVIEEPETVEAPPAEVPTVSETEAAAKAAEEGKAEEKK